MIRRFLRLPLDAFHPSFRFLHLFLFTQPSNLSALPRPTKKHSFSPESRERSFVLGCFLLDKRCVSGTANGGFHREWLIEGLVVEYFVVDWAVLYREIEYVSEELFIYMLNER